MKYRSFSIEKRKISLYSLSTFSVFLCKSWPLRLPKKSLVYSLIWGNGYSPFLFSWVASNTLEFTPSKNWWMRFLRFISARERSLWLLLMMLTSSEKLLTMYLGRMKHPSAKAASFTKTSKLLPVNLQNSRTRSSSKIWRV